MTQLRSFKPGDMVRCIKPKSDASRRYDLSPTRLYKVHAFGYYLGMQLEGCEYTNGELIKYAPYRFELVQSVCSIIKRYLEGDDNVETILRLLEDT